VPQNHLGVIDIGSNSTRLVVLRRSAGGEHRVVAEVKAVLRLQRGITPDGAMSEAAVTDLISLLQDFAAVAKARGAGEVRAVATSAVRESTNGAELLSRVKRETGIHLEILTGADEARLAYTGAVYGLPVTSGALVDIGGGSLELVRFEDRRIVSSWTLPLGAIKVTDAFLKSDPPSRKESAALRKHAMTVLKATGAGRLAPGEALVATGGTVRNLAKIDRRSMRRHFGTLHGYEIPLPRLRKAVSKLRGASFEQRKSVKGLNPERADSVLGGAIALLGVVDHLGARSVVVSGKGLRDGLAIGLAGDSLPSPASVRERSMSGLAEAFATWSPERAAVRRSVAAKLGTALPGLIDPEMLDLLPYAAAVTGAGSSLDYYNRFQHAAVIVETGDLNGFSRRDVALMSAILRSADDDTTDTSIYAGVLTADDLARARRAGVLAAIAEEIEMRTPRNTESDLSVSTSIRAMDLSAPGLQHWRPGRLAARFESAFSMKLTVSGRAGG
jgi:exopolyphosphatase/guanosine-5'-triphosphate,3'-diphosphate pyrophosphatase